MLLRKEESGRKRRCFRGIERVRRTTGPFLVLHCKPVAEPLSFHASSEVPAHVRARASSPTYRRAGKPKRIAYTCTHHYQSLAHNHSKSHLCNSRKHRSLHSKPRACKKRHHLRLPLRICIQSKSGPSRRLQSSTVCPELDFEGV